MYSVSHIILECATGAMWSILALFKTTLGPTEQYDMALTVRRCVVVENNYNYR